MTIIDTNLTIDVEAIMRLRARSYELGERFEEHLPALVPMLTEIKALRIEIAETTRPIELALRPFLDDEEQAHHEAVDGLWQVLDSLSGDWYLDGLLRRLNGLADPDDPEVQAAKA